MSNRFLALFLAVLNHGLANLAQNSKPAHSDTVMHTADDFVDYLEDVPIRHTRNKKT